MLNNMIDVHVGRQVRKRREELGWTPAALAAALGVPADTIGDIEDGAARLSVVYLWRASQALDVPVGYFFEGLSDLEESKRAETARRAR